MSVRYFNKINYLVNSTSLYAAWICERSVLESVCATLML